MVRFATSVCPLACGYLTKVNRCSIFISSHHSLNFAPENCLPLSATRIFGSPNLHMIFVQIKLITHFFEMMVSATASTHFEKYSTATTSHFSALLRVEKVQRYRGPIDRRDMPLSRVSFSMRVCAGCLQIVGIHRTEQYNPQHPFAPLANSTLALGFYPLELGRRSDFHSSFRVSHPSLLWLQWGWCISDPSL